MPGISHTTPNGSIQKNRSPVIAMSKGRRTEETRKEKRDEKREECFILVFTGVACELRVSNDIIHIENVVTGIMFCPCLIKKYKERERR